MEKKPFVTMEQVQEMAGTYPTPFHLYDEKGIRENAKRLKEAFAWNKGFREYFAVKATPNPFILNILKDYGCGTDCSSLTELMMSDACGFHGHEIMFSSNDTPPEEFQFANDLGAIINLDDITHIQCVEDTIGYIPETISCRYNPGGLFKISNDIMDNPGDAKYGMTTEQIFEAFKILKAKGAKNFGIHAFLASNTVTNEYYPMLAKVLFEVAVKLHEETGADIKFINLSGGIGIPYRPEQEPNDIFAIGEGVRKVYEEVLVPAGMGDVALYTELGRFMLAPYGCLVTKAIHEKHTHKEGKMQTLALFGSSFVNTLGQSDSDSFEQFRILRCGRFNKERNLTKVYFTLFTECLHRIKNTVMLCMPLPDTHWDTTSRMYHQSFFSFPGHNCRKQFRNSRIFQRNDIQPGK